MNKNYKINKKISNTIMAMLLFKSIINPSVCYGSGVDAYYDEGYLIIRDRESCNLSIPKSKIDDILDNEYIEIDETRINIDREEMDRLIKVADEHEKGMIQNTILACGLCGGTLLGTLSISKLLSKKIKK